MRKFNIKEEYSERFDRLRRDRIETSFYKYGPARANFVNNNVLAIPTLKLCLQKYEETGNTEYLCDLANYAMFEFMWPQHPNGHFAPTSSSESAGIVGLSVGELERMKNGDLDIK